MTFWPWYTYDAITFIRNRLSKTMRVFEYGCGSSTVFYIGRCAQVIAVDHDQKWVQDVIQQVKGMDVEITFIGPDKLQNRNSVDRSVWENPDEYYSHGWDAYFPTYVQFIDRFEDESFDVISIDGAARPSEMKHAISKLTPGGMFILDNSDRPKYARGVALVPAEWKRHDFAGKGSVSAWRQATEGETRTKLWQTTVWIKPNAA